MVDDEVMQVAGVFFRGRSKSPGDRDSIAQNRAKGNYRSKLEDWEVRTGFKASLHGVDLEKAGESRHLW